MLQNGALVFDQDNTQRQKLRANLIADIERREGPPSLGTCVAIVLRLFLFRSAVFSEMSTGLTIPGEGEGGRPVERR